MLLTTAILLAISSIIFEIGIAHRIPAYRKLASKNMVVNLTTSIGLSYILGMLFGASGLIAMLAGMLSTVGTIPYYKIMAGYDSFVEKNPEAIPKAKQRARDTVQTLSVLLAIFTAPVRIVRWIVNHIPKKETRHVHAA